MTADSPAEADRGLATPACPPKPWRRREHLQIPCRSRKPSGRPEAGLAVNSLQKQPRGSLRAPAPPMNPLPPAGRRARVPAATKPGAIPAMTATFGRTTAHILIEIGAVHFRPQ